MTYLAGWRMALAADLLLEPDARTGLVADKVGYGSPFAFSTAFKRVRGISPSDTASRTRQTRRANESCDALGRLDAVGQD
jgi:AraC-like DNA-binding protein